MSIQRFLKISAEPILSLADWLNYPYSITNRLMDRAVDVQLSVLSQTWGPANWWDKQVLHLADDRVMHREIMMYAESEPCWYARTIIPSQTYEADARFFNRLESESLGSLIFNEPKIKRVEISPYPMNDQCIEYYWLSPWLSSIPTVVWGRLCEFRLNEQYPFYLIEIMLPGLQRY